MKRVNARASVLFGGQNEFGEARIEWESGHLLAHICQNRFICRLDASQQVELLHGAFDKL